MKRQGVCRGALLLFLFLIFLPSAFGLAPKIWSAPSVPPTPHGCWPALHPYLLCQGAQHRGTRDPAASSCGVTGENWGELDACFPHAACCTFTIWLLGNGLKANSTTARKAQGRMLINAKKSLLSPPPPEPSHFLPCPVSTALGGALKELPCFALARRRC